jgi:DNA-binding NarL/FixJ family response regulator
VQQESKTILISDANHERRVALSQLCSSAGYKSILVDTVEDALRSVLASPGEFELAMVVCGPQSFETQKLRSLKVEVGKLVILAESADDLEMLTNAYDLGAEAYLKLHTQPQVILKSLELVNLGERLFPSRFVAFQARESIGSSPAGKRGPQLSARESEILAFLSTGESNRAIANKLAISEGTVKGHLRAITRKLGVPNRTKAAIWALEHGFAASTANQAVVHKA